MQKPQRKHLRLHWLHGLPLTSEFAMFFAAAKLFSESPCFLAVFPLSVARPLQMRDWLNVPRNQVPMQDAAPQEKNSVSV